LVPLIGPGIIYALQAATVGLVLLSGGAYLSGLVIIGIAVGIGGITWYLSWLSDQKPGLASLCFAGLTTLSILAGLLVLGRSVSLGLPGVICVLSWIGVAQARRVERLRATLPEIYRRKHGLERAQLHGESVREQRQASSRKRNARDRRGIALLLGGFALIAAVGGTAFWYSRQPSDPAPTLQAFRESWAANDVDGFAAHASSERIERGLRIFWKREDWGNSPPALIGWNQTKRTRDKVLVSFLVEGGLTSKTRWEWHGERWALYAFTVPK